MSLQMIWEKNMLKITNKKIETLTDCPTNLHTDWVTGQLTNQPIKQIWNAPMIDPQPTD